MLIVIFMEGAYVIEYIKLEKISCEKKLIREISNIIKKSNTTKTKHNPLITDDLIKTFVTELLSHNLFATYLGKDIAEEKKDIFKRFQELANIWTDRVLRINEVKDMYDQYIIDIYWEEKPILWIALSFIVKYYQQLIGKINHWAIKPKNRIAQTGGRVRKKILRVLMREEQREKGHALVVWENMMKEWISIHESELLDTLSTRQETDIYMGELGHLYAGFLVTILCTEQEYNKYMELYETTYKNSCHNNPNLNEYDLEKSFIQTIAHADPKRFEWVSLDAILK